MIPQDWEVKPLSALGTFMKGKGITRDDMVDEGVACVRYGELYTDYNDYIVTPTSRVPHSVAKTSLTIKYGDLLFAGSGETAEEIGKCAAFLSEEDACAGGDLVILRPVDQNSLYLGHLLNHHVVARQKARLGQGDAVVHISARNLGMVKVALPPDVSEQRAIAEALSDVDGLLRALEKLINKKRAIKQAAMQQLLTSKTRLPGFSGKWETKRIDELAEIKSGATPSTQVATFWNGSILWCTPTDITGTPGKYLSVTDRNVTEAGLAACAANLLPPGSLLLCSRATIGEVRIATTHICTNQGFKSLVCRPDVSNEFMYYMVLTLKAQMVEKSIGSTFLEIGKRDLASIQVSIPRKDEQMAIATALSDMDAEIQALERRRKKVGYIKIGMMQQLLNGRIRLVKPEAQAVATAATGDAKASKPHSWAFNEAVVISTLARHFGKEEFPLGRKRYTKLSYLLHRHAERQAEGYLKKAAGPCLTKGPMH
jgi:type I restriction enzyme S subunit